MEKKNTIDWWLLTFNKVSRFGLGENGATQRCITSKSLANAITSRQFLDVVDLSWPGCVTLVTALKKLNDTAREELRDDDFIEFHRILIDHILLPTLVRQRIIDVDNEIERHAHVPSFENLNFLPRFQRHGVVTFVRSVEVLNKPLLTPFSLILFGSYCSGRAEHFSDVDVALISSGFEGIPWLDRIRILRALLPPDGSVINPLGVTPAEYAEKKYPSILRAVRCGRSIYH
jgi:hypothetical protein